MRDFKMTWNFLAGIFDGEGHTRFDRHTNGSLKFTWQVTQKNLVLLDEIEFFLIEYGLRPMRQGNRTKHCGVIVLYRVGDVEFILRKLLPRVIVKREQIQSVLTVIENRPRKGDAKWREDRRKKTGARIGRTTPGTTSK